VFSLKNEVVSLRMKRYLVMLGGQTLTCFSF
jgi:hypothetical protein